VPHEKVPNVDEMRERVPLLYDDLFRVANPDGILVLGRGQSLWQRRSQDVEGLLKQRPALWLECPEKCNVDLENNLVGSVIGLDEAAHIDICPVLRCAVLALQPGIRGLGLSDLRHSQDAKKILVSRGG